MSLEDDRLDEIAAAMVTFSEDDEAAAATEAERQREQTEAMLPEPAQA